MAGRVQFVMDFLYSEDGMQWVTTQLLRPLALAMKASGLGQMTVPALYKQFRLQPAPAQLLSDSGELKCCHAVMDIVSEVRPMPLQCMCFVMCVSCWGFAL